MKNIVLPDGIRSSILPHLEVMTTKDVRRVLGALDAGNSVRGHGYRDAELARMARAAAKLEAQMTIGLIANPAGADQFTPEVGSAKIQAVNDDSAAFATGLFVEAVTPYSPNTNPPGGTVANTPFQVKRVPTSSIKYGLILGVSSGPYPAGQSTFPIGAVLSVHYEGPTQITCDDSESGTTIGDYITASSTTSGQGADTGSATPTVGEGLAVALQTVAIASGSASVWCYVHHV